MPTPTSIQRVYLGLLFGNTLAASFIWGINTIFLLDAGLANLEACAANALFSAGMVLFEVPTGIVADTVGRRASYLLGTVTLTASTFLYVFLWQIEAPLWQWAIASMLLGLGFTFFSGAVEAWLVDALDHAEYQGSLEQVFGRGQMVSGAAMLGGSVLGGVIAQATSLGVPFLLRVGVHGVVYLARDRFIHTDRVLKFPLNLESVRETAWLAHKMIRLSHPNIVQHYGVGQMMISGLSVPFLITEHVDGPSLAEYLKEHGRRRIQDRGADACAKCCLPGRH